MRPKPLNVDQLKACPPREADRVLHRDQLAVGEDVPADEASVPEAHPSRPQTSVRGRRGYSVIEKESAGPKRTEDVAEVPLQPFPADVLEHAHRADGVERAEPPQIAVVADRHRGLPFEAWRISAQAHSS